MNKFLLKYEGEGGAAGVKLPPTGLTGLSLRNGFR